jgi:acetate kinase
VTSSAQSLYGCLRCESFILNEREMPSYILSINCGSSSVKGKLFEIASDGKNLTPAASLAVTRVGAPGEKIQVKVEWTGDIKGKNIKEEGEDGDTVECKNLYSSVNSS